MNEMKAYLLSGADDNAYEHMPTERANRERELLAENERMRAALEFYADEDTYMWWLTDQPTAIEVDRGERARKALEGKRK